MNQFNFLEELDFQYISIQLHYYNNIHYKQTNTSYFSSLPVKGLFVAESIVKSAT